MKFSITYSRKIQTIQYESMMVELSAEFDTEDVPRDRAFNEVRVKVNQWMNNELESMGLSRRP